MKRQRIALSDLLIVWDDPDINIQHTGVRVLKKETICDMIVGEL